MITVRRPRLSVPVLRVAFGLSIATAGALLIAAIATGNSWLIVPMVAAASMGIRVETLLSRARGGAR